MKTTKPCVLIVDDYADNREMYVEYMLHKGYDVVEATNGNEAIERAFSSRLDLVVMDLSLPGIDGWEATRRLKADPRTKGIPVVVVTGHAHSEDLETAKAAGCDAFLTKPCLPQELFEKVESMLGRGAAPSFTPRPPASKPRAGRRKAGRA
jgi:CheY-like chemotaxis protein